MVTASSYQWQTPVRKVLSSLNQRQGNTSCVCERGPALLSSQDRQDLADLHDRTANLEPDNIYALGALAFLSGVKLLPSAEEHHGFRTIEDYLFGTLWRAVQHSDPVSELVKLGEGIRNLGSDYFSSEETGGWSYALPLLAAQQFRTALAYLPEAGSLTGLLQATHLGLVLSLGGVSANNLGKDSPDIVTELLVIYATKLENESWAGPVAALEYLLRISGKERLRKEVRI